MDEQEKPEVATHVLVPAEHADKLRKLAARTRVNQSEYLREAVDDLLSKYAANDDTDAKVMP